MKYFTAKRAEEKRNKPPTKAQQRSVMTTYLKNMAEWKPKDLKNKSFANVQELFKKAMKRLDKKVEAKVDDAKEAKELKQCLEIVPDDGDDVTVDATPLFVKIPIVDYKIYQEGKKSFFKIIRADRKTQMYLTFTKMLKNFDREDLEVLWRIVEARFKKTEPVNYMDIFLHLHLKTMFEHHVEDNIWKNQQGLVKVLNWKLFDSYGVHCVTVEGDFPRVNLRNIEDMLLLLVQKKLSNLERDVIYDLNVALRMFTRRVVILKRVSDITNMTPYTAYNNPQGIIYLDKFKRNRLIRSDELYKFYDGTLTSIRRLLPAWR
ncbi:hypothetical protein Tco_1370296 [Tanacetum coccineum]